MMKSSPECVFHDPAGDRLILVISLPPSLFLGAPRSPPGMI